MSKNMLNNGADLLEFLSSKSIADMLMKDFNDFAGKYKKFEERGCLEYQDIPINADPTPVSTTLSLGNSIQVLLSLGNYENKLQKLWIKAPDRFIFEKASRQLMVRNATFSNLKKSILSASLLIMARDNDELFLTLLGLVKREIDQFKVPPDCKDMTRYFNMLESKSSMYLNGYCDYFYGLYRSNNVGISDDDKMFAFSLSQILKDTYKLDQPQCKAVRYADQLEMPRNKLNQEQTDFERRVRGEYFNVSGNFANAVARARDKSNDPVQYYAQFKILSESLFLLGVDLEEIIREYKVDKVDISAISQALYRYSPSFEDEVNMETMIIPLIITTALAKEIMSFKQARIKEFAKEIGGEKVSRKKRRLETPGSGKVEKEYQRRIRELEDENRKNSEEIERLKEEYRTGIEKENIRLIRESEKTKSSQAQAVQNAADIAAELALYKSKIDEMQDLLDEQTPDDEIETVFDERSFVLLTVSGEFGAGMKRLYFPNAQVVTKSVIPIGQKKPVVCTMMLINHKTTKYLEANNFNWYKLWTKNKKKAAVEIRDFLDQSEDEGHI